MGEKEEMITLPITCTQAWIILACAIFAVGLYIILTFDYTVRGDIPLFTLGLFMVGFPSAFGIGASVWYSGVFIGKHVRCKCE